MKPPLKTEIRKPTKTLSGVTPVAVMLAPRKCRHGTCLYCPTLSAPQSYTPKSPAVMRAIMLNYSPYEQVRARLKAYEVMNHPTDKIELIIMGGTFLNYPLKYQYSFIKSCYDALNNKKSTTLKEAKKLNERAKHRAVALCIETRPDVCGEKETFSTKSLMILRLNFSFAISHKEVEGSIPINSHWLPLANLRKLPILVPISKNLPLGLYLEIISESLR